MKELQKKQRIRKMLYSLPVLILLLVVTGFLSQGALGVVGKQMESERHLEELEGKAAVLSARRAELEGNIRALETEDGVIEEIKGKFSVTEEGEYVAILVDEVRKASTTEPEEETWSSKWWHLVKSLWQR
ncbi:MAG: hypothetical protein WDZ61_00320 [Parcubacteria group bacterium]